MSIFAVAALAAVASASEFLQVEQAQYSSITVDLVPDTNTQKWEFDAILCGTDKAATWPDFEFELNTSRSYVKETDVAAIPCTGYTITDATSAKKDNGWMGKEATAQICILSACTGTDFAMVQVDSTETAAYNILGFGPELDDHKSFIVEMYKANKDAFFPTFSLGKKSDGTLSLQLSGDNPNLYKALGQNDLAPSKIKKIAAATTYQLPIVGVSYDGTDVTITNPIVELSDSDGSTFTIPAADFTAIATALGYDADGSSTVPCDDATLKNMEFRLGNAEDPVTLVYPPAVWHTAGNPTANCKFAFNKGDASVTTWQLGREFYKNFYTQFYPSKTDTAVVFRVGANAPTGVNVIQALNASALAVASAAVLATSLLF